MVLVVGWLGESGFHGGHVGGKVPYLVPSSLRMIFMAVSSGVGCGTVMELTS